MFHKKDGKDSMGKEKVIRVAGCLVLTVAAICFIPDIQKRLADKLYQKMK